jgi:hypothetical protein
MASIADQVFGQPSPPRPTRKAITEKIPQNYRDLPEEERKAIALRLARQLREGPGHQPRLALRPRL